MYMTIDIDLSFWDFSKGFMREDELIVHEKRVSEHPLKTKVNPIVEILPIMVSKKKELASIQS